MKVEACKIPVLMVDAVIKAVLRPKELRKVNVPEDTYPKVPSPCVVDVKLAVVTLPDAVAFTVTIPIPLVGLIVTPVPATS